MTTAGKPRSGMRLDKAAGIVARLLGGGPVGAVKGVRGAVVASFAALLGLAFPGSASAQQEFMPRAFGHPAPSDEPVATEQGIFPTYHDTLYMGGFNGHRGDYARSPGGHFSSADGPDLISMTADGFWDYDDPEPNFYERNPKVFAPVDHLLGLFARNELIAVESPDEHSAVAEVDLVAPLGFTRNFDPQRAHAKMGPAYLDVLFVGAGVVFSDYEGTPALREDDGWIGIVELGVRGAMRLTDSLYVTLTGSFYYLPFEDRWGVNLADLNGGSLVRLGYEFQLGDWDFLAYDSFRAHAPFYDLFEDLEREEFDAAGRYRFGHAEGGVRSNQYFDEDFLYFVNQVGLRGSTPFAADQWRLYFDGHQLDWWRTEDFDDHDSSRHLELLAGYEGNQLWFSPYARYAFTGFDDFDMLFHRLYLGATGKLTENISVRGEAGYIWAGGDAIDRELDQFLWSFTIQHQIAEPITQSITVGQDFVESPVGDAAVSDYVQYRLRQRFGPRIYGNLFAQYGESELVRPVVGNDESLAIGAGIEVRPWDFTGVQFRAYYREYEALGTGTPRAYDSWVYQVTVLQQLFSRTQATMAYRYEESEATTSEYSEHLLRFGLRTYF